MPRLLVEHQQGVEAQLELFIVLTWAFMLLCARFRADAMQLLHQVRKMESRELQTLKFMALANR